MHHKAMITKTIPDDALRFHTTRAHQERARAVRNMVRMIFNRERDE